MLKKFSPLSENIEGKRIVIVDDSIGALRLLSRLTSALLHVNAFFHC